MAALEAREVRLNKIISEYNKLVKNIDKDAAKESERAYGGIIRAGKGGFVESMTKDLVRIAWENDLKQDPSRMDINKNKIPITVQDGYIARISDPKVKKYVQDNCGNKDFSYKFGTDVQVFIDNCMALPIECKAYSENAMLKRILFDALLMKGATGVDTYYLVQLESQLGGDYSELNDVTYGSPATHALLSCVNVELKIITLLKGERRVDKPIHKPEFFKELEMEELSKAVELFADALKKYRR